MAHKPGKQNFGGSGSRPKSVGNTGASGKSVAGRGSQPKTPKASEPQTIKTAELRSLEIPLGDDPVFDAPEPIIEADEPQPAESDAMTFDGDDVDPEGYMQPDDLFDSEAVIDLGGDSDGEEMNLNLLAAPDAGVSDGVEPFDDLVAADDAMDQPEDIDLGAAGVPKSPPGEVLPPLTAPPVDVATPTAPTFETPDDTDIAGSIEPSDMAVPVIDSDQDFTDTLADSSQSDVYEPTAAAQEGGGLSQDDDMPEPENAADKSGDDMQQKVTEIQGQVGEIHQFMQLLVGQMLDPANRALRLAD